MTNFEVVYTYGENGEYILPSRVYAVDPKDNTFLIVDGWGKFHWVRVDRCVEKSLWEFEHGSLDFAVVTTGYWDDPNDDRKD